MLHRLSAAATVLATLCIAPISTAQTPPTASPPAAPAAVYVPTSLTPEPGLPRTPDGRPDLQGVVWATNFFPVFEATPLASSLTVSEPEAKKIVDTMVAGFRKIPGFDLDPEAEHLISGTDGLPIVRGQRRTRLVVLPADGKVPMTPETRKLASSSNPAATGPLDNPEQRPVSERCLALNARPPMVMPIAYVRFRFIQTPTHVVIHSEDGDEVRLIPYADAHPVGVSPNWLGDSIARWEGATLVIETIRAPRQGRVRGFSSFVVNPGSKVIERFTRVAEDELLYQFTVEDPELYTAPWLAEYSLYSVTTGMFPGNCHAGNYSLPNILQAARVADARAAKPQR
jgi:hypothetical protein